MATISYYLKTPELKESPIYLRVSVKGKRIRIPSGEKIPSKYWNDKPTCRAKKTTAFPEGSDLNDFLNKLEKKTSNLIKSFKRNGDHFTTDTLKEKIKDFLNVGELKPNSFFAIYDQFLATTSTQKSERTIEKFKTLRRHLTAFQRVKRTNINFDSINIGFYDKLTDYYLNDLGVVNNTFGKYVSSLKTFLNWATDRGHNQKIEYRKFKVFHDEADIIYLTDKELHSIVKTDLSQNTRLANIRDVFCLGCYTGLRFSDLVKLKPENIKTDHIIIKTQKTRDTLFIPLKKEAKEIINRYLDKPGFLPVISNQKMNDYLEELAKNANIKEEVTITRYQGAKEIKITKPKFEM
ncbi:MAG: phage integrase SAM-like domain-containing protein, partial [Bacteroidetes bacterium]|nr:phage integrase SAM-like domain-containing protein [Bacteroidota bacterium]